MVADRRAERRLWRHPLVRALALTIFVFNVMYGAAFSVYVLLVQERLGLSNVGFGLLLAAPAVGGLMASVAYPVIHRWPTTCSPGGAQVMTA